MKIVLVGSGVVSIPPKNGGATELIVYEMSKALSIKNDVTVFDLKERWNREKERIGKAKYVRINVPRITNIFLLRASEFLFGTKCLVKAAALKSDITHCQTVFSALPFALIKNKSNLVYSSHNPAWTSQRSDFFNELIMKIEGFVMKRSDHVITVSNEMAEAIARKTGIPKNKISVIYNFVDTSLFSPKRKTWKETHDIKGPMILFVGKLSPNKGVEYFIRAAAIAKKHINQVKFVIVGPVSFEGQAKNKWQQLVDNLNLNDCVVFAGAASNTDLPYIYSSADVFCFPTLKEAFGIVVIEAMASGLPIITTDLPVLHEVTGETAIFVPEKNPEAIAKSIEKLLADRKKMNDMRKKSLKRAKVFAKENILKNYETVYSLLPKKASY